MTCLIDAQEDFLHCIVDGEIAITETAHQLMYGPLVACKEFGKRGVVTRFHSQHQRHIRAINRWLGEQSGVSGGTNHGWVARKVGWRRRLASFKQQGMLLVWAEEHVSKWLEVGYREGVKSVHLENREFPERMP